MSLRGEERAENKLVLGGLVALRWDRGEGGGAGAGGVVVVVGWGGGVLGSDREEAKGWSERE